MEPLMRHFDEIYVIDLRSSVISDVDDNEVFSISTSLFVHFMLLLMFTDVEFAH